MRLSDFLIGLDRVVAFYPALTRITGGAVETLFLCQLIYWIGKQHDPDGWIYKTQAEIQEETGLTRREQETARRNLRRLGFVEEDRRGVPARLYYRVCLDAVNDAWELSTIQDGGNGHS